MAGPGVPASSAAAGCARVQASRTAAAGKNALEGRITSLPYLRRVHEDVAGLPAERILRESGERRRKFTGTRSVSFAKYAETLKVDG
jgi:hypothetical protein